MEPEELKEEAKEVGEIIDELLEKSEQQATDIKRAKRELDELKRSLNAEPISSEQEA